MSIHKWQDKVQMVMLMKRLGHWLANVSAAHVLHHLQYYYLCKSMGDECNEKLIDMSETSKIGCRQHC